MSVRPEQFSATTEDLVVRCINAVLDELNADLPTGLKLSHAADTALYGPQGQLDSLALVHLIVAIEQRIDDELGIALTLADERALSEHHSPFATVGSLTAYVRRLLERVTAPLG